MKKLFKIGLSGINKIKKGKSCEKDMPYWKTISQQFWGLKNVSYIAGIHNQRDARYVGEITNIWWKI